MLEVWCQEEYREEQIDKALGEIVFVEDEVTQEVPEDFYEGF